ncbi:MAG: polyprenyl synthetase family protein [Chlamydiota bacterium]
MDVKTYLSEKGRIVQTHLDTLVAEKELPQDSLYRAAKYSLMAGGKRLRPILAIATAESFGCEAQLVLNAACALELVHTYSLIHDDLPCMDDDDLRRGKPTLHKVYPEAHAILAGDYLLTYAFEVIATDSHLTEEQKVKLITTLSQSAGGLGMIGGQVMDIEAENRQVKIEELQCIHRNKTGAMITASVIFGGIIAGASEKQLEMLKLYGEDIGLAFQIIDDVLDVTQSEEVLGKTAGSDILNNKSTYVSLMGLEQAHATAQSLLHSSQERINSLPITSPILRDLSHYIVNRQD